jgi:hypothetical protein
VQIVLQSADRLLDAHNVSGLLLQHMIDMARRLGEGLHVPLQRLHFTMLEAQHSAVLRNLSLQASDVVEVALGRRSSSIGAIWGNGALLLGGGRSHCGFARTIGQAGRAIPRRRLGEVKIVGRTWYR